jgi:Holliday junction resolvase RusA-like endonuclease
MNERTVIFTIPGDPVGKGRARSTNAGIHYTPQKTRNYEAFVKMLAVEAMRGEKPIEGACAVEILVKVAMPKSTSKKNRDLMLRDFIRPTKKPDNDNIEKAINDAMNGVVFTDDVQIVDNHTVKTYSDYPETTVYVRELEKC